MTKLGVFVQNYNYGCFIEDAIRSVKAQTLQPDELFIIDDCSTRDNYLTNKVAEAYGIKLIRNDTNMGCVAILNKAVTLLEADYICGLSADDKLGTIDYLEQMKSTLDTNPEVGIAYCNYHLFSTTERYPVNFQEFNEEDLMRGNYIHGSAMYRKECFNQVNGYPETNIAEDWAFWVNIVNKGWKAKKVSGVYLDYRQHEMGSRNKGTEGNRRA